MTSAPEIIVVDIFRDIVAKVQTAAIAAGICTSVRYFHGPVQELLKDLQAITAAIGEPGYTGSNKYPCIYLLQDFPEDMTGANGYDVDVSLPVIAIMALSEQNLSSDERYDKNFRPILYPLYKLLKKYIADNPRTVVHDPDDIPHIKYDRLFYGRNKFGASVTDYVDAIELNNIKLTFAKATSC